MSEKVKLVGKPEHRSSNHGLQAPYKAISKQVSWKKYMEPRNHMIRLEAAFV